MLVNNEINDKFHSLIKDFKFNKLDYFIGTYIFTEIPLKFPIFIFTLLY